MKTLNGVPAINILKMYVDEEYARINFKEIEETLSGNSNSFDVQVLVLNDGETFFDYRFFDPFHLLPVAENSCLNIRSDGWSHWQCESNESRIFEGCVPEEKAAPLKAKIEMIIATVNEADLPALMEAAGIVVFDGDDYRETDDGYALMWNNEKSELFFLEYATNSNGWAQTACQQNDFLFLAYVTPIETDSVSRCQLEAELESKFYEELHN